VGADNYCKQITLTENQHRSFGQGSKRVIAIISTATGSARYDYGMSSLLVWFLIGIVLLLSLGFVKMFVLNTL
jgi:hypothetical protein